ncbi:SusC/RagA family TonB-linked outer membrane protein [Aestuariibaculum sp. M13]|uniref:SusC/RagA family TonB-linked outer membrane protein n=1 Tax=Aestuariibaculum sp. M13 TaxID=2967132 RepID=UPI002159FFF5|nr:SusC/RagA family TonB-linked outer membrane protein [Aestuariibaculum sp. M13]MCR8669313.1 SusC/RagA family TonB-linked outer membrane protein [Aestuariibaculum sp. M13]
MRVFIFLLCATVFGFNPNTSFSQEKVFINQNQSVSVDEMFNIIQQQTNYHFIFPKKLFKDSPTIQLEQGEVLVISLLDRALKNSSLEFEIDENNTILIKKVDHTYDRRQQKVKVSGTITDATGMPLPGVTVMEKGTQNGVATDFNGVYSITVADNAVLEFSYVGFLNETREVSALTYYNNVNITLKENVNALQEVVVTGYQTLSKERTAGSFTKLTAEDIQLRPSSANILDRLRGQVSGLSVSPATGLINIRGRSTIFSSQETPLIVIDGFPMSDQSVGNLNTNLGGVNPEDIESVTILKDASAASIWGSRAANGVIVITTKSGSKKSRTKVDFSSFVELEEKINTDDFMWMNTAEEIELDQEFIDKNWVNFNTLVNSPSSINDLHLAYIYRNGISPDGNVWSQNTFNNYIEELKSRDINKEFSKHFFRNAIRKTHNLSMSGGGENNTYYTSLAYTDYQSANIGNDDDRLTLTVNNTYNFNDKIKFTSLVTGAMRKQTNNSVSPSFGTPGAAQILQQLQPYDRILDDNGNLQQYYVLYNPWISQQREQEVGAPHTFNWLEERLNKNDTDLRLDFRTRFQLDAEVFNGLTLSSAFAYELNYLKSDIYRGMNLPSHRNFINNYYVNGEYQIPLGTDYEHERNVRRGWVFRNSINWDKTWDNHQLTVLALGEYQKSFSDNIFNRQLGFDEQSLQYAAVNETLTNGVADFNGARLFSRPSDYFRQGIEDLRQVSYASNLAYTYADKYTFNGSVRVDQANVWGSDPKYRYKPLWSTAAGWELGKEDFMSALSWVDRLKLRASYGIGGITSDSSSPYAQAFATSIFWGRQYPYTRLSVPANPGLRWAQVATTNIGLDFSLFGNKFSGSAEYYVRKSSDILGRRGIDPTTGWDSATLNYAATDNKGIELTLKTDVLNRNNFNWNIQANINYNKNILTEFFGENNTNPSALVNGATFLEGDPFFTLYAYKFGGLNENGELMVWRNERKGNELLGEADEPARLVHWRDIPSQIELEDMESQGSEIAPHYGGIINTFTYKNFDLTVMADYQFGHIFKDRLNYSSSSHGAYNNFNNTANNVRTHQIWNDRWREPGDENFTNVPRLYYNGTNPLTGAGESRFDTNNQAFYWTSSNINYHKADFIRIQEIILGYNMPQQFLDKTFFNNLRFSFQVTNPYLWTANDVGRDPEANYQEAFINLTRYTFGLRATF